MGARLHVTNLPEHPNAGSLGDHFAQCGRVASLNIVIERGTARAERFALIVMETDAAARSAFERLNGVPFEGRPLHVRFVERSKPGERPLTIAQPAPQQPQHTPRHAAAQPRHAAAQSGYTPSRPKTKPEPDESTRNRSARETARDEGARESQRVQIKQQFRERHNMTYELDCAGTPLILRVFFPVGDGPTAEWRIEARTSNACDAPVTTGGGKSKAQALQRIAEGWLDVMPPPSLDWNGVVRAMTDVRAL